MSYSDIAIMAIVSITGFYFHWWLYVRIKRWINHDLALSLAGDDAGKRAYMLEQLELANKNKVKKAELADWLKAAAERYSPTA